MQFLMRNCFTKVPWWSQPSGKKHHQRRQPQPQGPQQVKDILANIVLEGDFHVQF